MSEMSEFLAILFRGAVIGVAVAAPVGPIGLLCIRRTLAGGAVAGIASGMGAAMADAVYGVVAVAGLGVVTALLVDHADALKLGGGLLLLWLAAKALRPVIKPGTIPSVEGAVGAGATVLGGFAATFSLTIANPMTIIAFAAIITGLSDEGGADGIEGAITVAGIFLGSVAWWFFLIGLVSLIRMRLTARAFRLFDLVSGLVLAAFGLYSIASVWRG